MRRRSFMFDESLYEWVDLGLPSGLKWATWNIGATKPEEYGLYFAWGETQGYTGITDDKKFTWGDYEFTTAATGTTDIIFRGGLTKYNSVSTSGVVDNLTTLESSDDSAYQSDKTCRMPTSGECQELINNTTSAWTTDYNGSGVSGVIFTSTKEGYTDKSIFLPAAGFCLSGSPNYAGSIGQYWSSSVYKSVSRLAWVLYFHAGDVYMSNYLRYQGHSVRPVKE